MSKASKSEQVQKELVYVPMICFKGQDEDLVESPEGRPVRNKAAMFFYFNKKEAETALQEMVKQYGDYTHAAKVVIFKRVKDAK